MQEIKHISSGGVAVNIHVFESLSSCGILQVDDLKAKLAVQELELKHKNEDADKLIHVVGVETEKVSREKAIADEEELKVQVINLVGLFKILI